MCASAEAGSLAHSVKSPATAVSIKGPNRRAICRSNSTSLRNHSLRTAPSVPNQKSSTSCACAGIGFIASLAAELLPQVGEFQRLQMRALLVVCRAAVAAFDDLVVHQVLSQGQHARHHLACVR